MWISTALIIRNVHNKKWFWTAYDIVAALLSLTAIYVMVLDRYGNISNQTSDIAIFTLVGAIILQIVGLIVKLVIGNDEKET